MGANPSFSIEIDQEADAAYVRFSSNPVSWTQEFSDLINVDLDAVGMVVGIEVLDLDAVVPLDELANRYHIDSAKLSLLSNMIKMQATPQVTATSASARPVADYNGVRASQMGDRTPCA